MTDPAGNKTMSLREAHSQLAPFAKYTGTSPEAEEAVEELLLLLSLAFEDCACMALAMALLIFAL